MIQIGIVGAAGYTGMELMRLVLRHPKVHLAWVSSREHAGTSVNTLLPYLHKATELRFAEPDKDEMAALDIVFFATPNGTAMRFARHLLENNVKVIDLAADFRLKKEALWQQYYGMPHRCPELLEQAVYGLVDYHQDAIQKASLIANPGCYPTAVQLALLPLLEADCLASKKIIANCVSGISGAGKTPVVSKLFAETNENFYAYGLPNHRHTPEILQGLEHTGGPYDLLFVPHIAPMTRGIHATIYVEVKSNQDIQQLYEQRYKKAAFIHVLKAGTCPQARSVRGSNHCQIGLHFQPQTKQLVIFTVIDNLVKGAAGQALENMNLMCGFSPNLGLDQLALVP